MIWTLDMDDFNGQFCRKTKRRPPRKFPLITAIKDEFEQMESTTPISTLPIDTSTLSNETILLNDLFQNLLDDMFVSATSSSPSTVALDHVYVFFFYLLTGRYLIGSTIDIVA